MRIRQRLSTRLVFLVCVTGLAILFHAAQAHESCCKYKLALHGEQAAMEPEFISDPTAVPPTKWEGESHYIDDPNDVKPDYWDDEDDGDWAPIRILNPKFAWTPPQIHNPNYIPPPTYWDKLQVEIKAAIPWVTLGVLITGLLSLIPLPISTLQGWLAPSKGSSETRWFAELGTCLSASILGLAIPLCSCGALPLCAGLIQHGVPLSSAVAFLIASQSAGLDSAAITYGLLGLPAMLGRLLGAMLLAVGMGLTCASLSSKASPTLTATPVMCHGSSPSPAAPVSVRSALSACFETALEIYPTVLAGLALSTWALHSLPSITSYVSKETSSGDDSLLWMDLGVRLLVLGAALPLQLCEHTSVALAAALQQGGASPGLSFAFLLSAPAVNLPTLLLFSRFLGTTGGDPGADAKRRTWMGGTLQIVPLIGALLVTAVAISYSIDNSQWDLLAGESTGEMAALPGWWVDSSPYLAVFLVGGALDQFYNHPHSNSVGDVKDACCTPNLQANEKKHKTT